MTIFGKAAKVKTGPVPIDLNRLGIRTGAPSSRLVERLAAAAGRSMLCAAVEDASPAKVGSVT